MPNNVEITRVGSFTLGWGESVVWDEQRERLYFVDCMASTLHWLDDVADEPGTWTLPSMPTGIVPARDGRLVAVLDDGLHVLDVDTRQVSLLARYPGELGSRANDACADLEGNVITGTLNLGPAEGSAWWYSARDGWRMLDPDISNTNGPTVAVVGGTMTLIIGDTSADYFSYPYDAASGAVGARTVFGAVGALDGMPDGATLDDSGGLWCALVGGGQLVRFTIDGLDRTVPLPVANPTDVTFGGPDLDRLYVTSIAGSAADESLDGALLVIDGLGMHGRPEPRAAVPA
jgi:sugar lactone lactonase YvrE